MTNYYYSSSQNVFIARGSQLLKTEEFGDAVAVSDEVFNEYFRTVNGDKRRIAGADGLPAWEDIPPPTAAEIEARAIAEAEQKKSQLLAEASEVTSGWQADLLLGTISDEDRAKLIEWRAHIKELEAVDTSSAPDIDWPIAPVAQVS